MESLYLLYKYLKDSLLLEHQLDYIKESSAGGYDAPYFEKYEDIAPEMINDLYNAFENFDFETMYQVILKIRK